MKTIRQTATIRGPTPHDLYETIMDSKRHSKLSQQPTTVSRRVGGAFKVGHDLEGKHLALTKDKKIARPEGLASLSCRRVCPTRSTARSARGGATTTGRRCPPSGQARHGVC